MAKKAKQLIKELERELNSYCRNVEPFRDLSKASDLRLVIARHGFYQAQATVKILERLDEIDDKLDKLIKLNESN